jgi:hypothetical protein
MALSPAELSMVAGASRAPIVQAIADFKQQRRPEWLSATNVFPNGIPPRRWAQARRNLPSLLELIAVSEPNHCIDGWGFLARSLSALIAGDMHAARHFAYYAQLRASLAILACEGIGVFDHLNCVVTPSGHFHQIDELRRAGRPLGTHEMAWLALGAWARGAASGSAIAQAITIRKVSFDACLKSMWPGTGGRPGGYDLILAWGIDLQRAVDDRRARNASSYTAQILNPLQQTADETLDFLVEFWGTFEPESGDPFLSIDRHLLRLMVKTQHRIISPTSTTAQVASEVMSRHAKLDPIVQATITSDFLSRRAVPDDPIIVRQARARSNPSHPTEMISRAALLLRSATAMVTQVLFDAGVNGTPDLDFCLLPFGSDLGLWDRSGPPTPMHELWADVRQALDDVLATRARCTNPPFSRFEWATEENGLPRIFEAERIVLWGLCP